MPNTGSRGGPGPVRTIALVAAGALPWAQGPAVAGEWSINPSLEAAETYTDNVALAPPGEEEDEWITEVNPALTVIGEGNRADVRLDYRMQNVFYADQTDSSATYHQLAADATGQVVPRTLHVDADTSYAQQLISPADPVPTSNVTVSNNRTDVFTAGVSPYLMHRFGNYAQGQARYRYQRVEYGGESFDSESYITSVYLESGPRFEWWGWRLDGQNQRITYDERPDTRFRQGRGELNVQVAKALQVFGSGGYEENEFERAGGQDEPDGTFWEAGFRWNPSRRTSLEAAMGERYYGETKRAQLQHSTRHTTWSLSYREELTTLTQLASERQVFVVPTEGEDGELEPTLVSLEVPALTTEVYLSERYSGSVTIRSPKSTVNLSAFNDVRTFQTSNETETTTGGNVSWVWEFGARTRSDIGANFLRREYRATDREDDLWFGHARLIRDLRRNLEATLSYERTQREIRGEGVDYRQNVVSLRARLRF